MSIKIAKNLKRERTWINPNLPPGQNEIKEGQFIRGDTRPNMGRHPGAAGLQPAEDKEETKKN